MPSRTHLALMAVAFACGLACAKPAPTLKAGEAVLQLSTDGQTLTFSRGSTTLLTFHPDSFQIGTVDASATGTSSFDPYWLAVTDPPAPPIGLTWRQVAAGAPMKLVSLSATAMALEFDCPGATAKVTFTAEPPNRFSAQLVPSVTGGQSIGYLRIRPDAGATEGFYGLGEWGDSVNHRGKLRPMQMEADTSLENSDDENHAPVPLLLGTNGWGLFVKSMRPGSFGVATESATAIDVVYGTAADSAAGLEFHLFAEANPLDLLKHYYDVTGYPRLPAPWALGPWMWRGQIASEQQVLDDINQIRSRHLATSGSWFDRLHSTGVETFDFNPATFPDPPTMLQALHDAGFRYAVWHAPYTAPAGNSEDPAPVENAYATENDFFPPLTGVPLNQWSKPIDFTNPSAWSWWQSNLRQYSDPLGSGGFGVEGFKLDYGEDVMVGLLPGAAEPWRFADGSDEFTMHYGYQLLYHRMYSQLLPSAGGFLLCRTARWGDQVNGAIIWPGDLDASFAQQGDPLPGKTLLAVGGLPPSLMKGISLSASGFPFYASDTGGYKNTPATEETFIRWTEANAVQTAMEVGDGAGGSSFPWEFTAANGWDDESLADYQSYASLHTRLFPYEWSYAQQLATTGRPILRPFGLAFPAVGQHPNDEYAFGDSLLVAPVVAAGLTSRPVILPPGTWIGWWDGQPYEGGANGATITAAADLDTLPLYLAAGGIVPMLRDTIDTLAPATNAGVDSFANNAGVLSVRVAPAAPKTSFTVYDGTVITQSKAGALTLTFQPGSVFTQGALFEVIGTASPGSVTSGSTALTQQGSLADLEAAADGWFSEAATGGTVWMKVPGQATVTVQ